MPRRVRLTETILGLDGSETTVPRADVWPLPGSTVGYVVNRNGVATARHGNAWKSLGMPFTAGNRHRAVRAAEAWVRTRQRAGLPTPARPERPRWAVAWLAYRDAKLAPDGTTTERRAYRRHKLAFDRFTEGASGEISDDAAFALTVAGLDGLNNGIEGVHERLAPGTARVRLQSWRRFLDYCRARGWLTTDPVALVRTPRLPSKRGKARVYTARELYRMDRWLARHGGPRSRQYRLLGRFLLLTGARIHEALALRWSDVHDDYIALETTKGDRPRPFPLGPFPELRRVLERLRREPPGRSKKGGRNARLYVFPWASDDPTVDTRIAMLAALGIDGGTRPVHVFRATAIHRWRELGIPFETRAGLAGHSKNTMFNHYDAAQSADELAAAVLRALE